MKQLSWFAIVTLGFMGMTEAHEIIEGSGTTVTEVRQVTTFSDVIATAGYTVEVQIGTVRKIEVSGDNNIVSHIITKVEGSQLILTQEDSTYLRPNAPLIVRVFTPGINRIVQSGAGDIRVQGIASTTLSADLSGSGNITLSGTTNTLTATLSGAGTIWAKNLVSKNTDATLSGSGTIEVCVKNDLNAAISGSGTVLYSCDPQHVYTNITGAGYIIESE